MRIFSSAEPKVREAKTADALRAGYPSSSVAPALCQARIFVSSSLLDQRRRARNPPHRKDLILSQ
jgi:hypothetical protein